MKIDLKEILKLPILNGFPLQTNGFDEEAIRSILDDWGKQEGSSLLIANGVPDWVYSLMYRLLFTNNKIYGAVTNNSVVGVEYDDEDGEMQALLVTDDGIYATEQKISYDFLVACLSSILANNLKCLDAFLTYLNSKEFKDFFVLMDLLINEFSKILDCDVKTLNQEKLLARTDTTGLKPAFCLSTDSIVMCKEVDINLFLFFTPDGGKSATVESSDFDKKDFSVNPNRTFKDYEEIMMNSTEFRLKNYVPVTTSKDMVEAFFASSKSETPIMSALLYGPSGTGKTELVQFLANKLDLPVVTFQCTANTDESDLVGKPKSLGIQTNSDGKIDYTDTPLTKAIKNGWIIEIQEIASIKEAAVIQIFNSLLDGTRLVLLPNGEQLNVHPDFKIVFTTNISYEGCQLLNQSFISRCQFVSNVTMPSDEEIVDRLISQIGWTGERSFPQIAVAAMHKINKYLIENALDDGSCDFRAAKDWLQLYKNTPSWSFLKCAEYTIIPKATFDVEHHDALLAIVKTIIE